MIHGDLLSSNKSQSVRNDIVLGIDRLTDRGRDFGLKEEGLREDSRKIVEQSSIRVGAAVCDVTGHRDKE